MSTKAPQIHVCEYELATLFYYLISLRINAYDLIFGGVSLVKGQTVDY